jgi:very-short-patch-repair endonuclease
MPSADPVPILRQRGGCSRRAVLLDEGVSERGLARAAAAGHVRRVSRGVYALPEADAAIVAAVRCGGLLTCSSRAAALGLAVLTPARRIHLATRNNPVGPTSSVILHRSRVRQHPGPLPIASAVDCAAQALRCLSALAALVIVDSSLATGRVTEAEIRERLGTKKTAAARMVLTLADGSSESPLESIARVLLRVRGLNVQTQVHVKGVGRVDLLVEGALVVELDGFEHHSDRADYRNDRRRANALTCLGLRLIRFTYEDVVHRPSWVVACVLEALRRVPRSHGT